MAWDSERELEKIFLSHNKILRNFKILEIRTRNGKEITNKDLIVNRTEKFDLKIHIRKPINLKSTMIIDDAFLLLNSKCEGMAIVIDENKEFIGVVTLEDILESVVGNIFDEYDKTGGELVEFGTVSSSNGISEKDKDNEII